MTLDQCLSCTRYEPIIGQVYAILDESGTNITQILDDAQMSYTNLDDYIKLSRTEEMLDEKKMADIKEEIKETPKTFKDTMEEGFIMDWNNVPLETQKPNIAEYDAEGIEPNKPIIKSPNNQPKKENEFKDRLREKYSFKDYYVEGFCIDINKYIKTGEIEERESYFLFGYDGDIIEIDNLVNIKENK